MKQIQVALCFSILFFVQPRPIMAQNLEAKVYSVYIFNFAKLIQWPQIATDGDFVIGILGDSPVSQELKTMASVKNVGNRKVVVKVFNSLEDVAGCQLVFVAASKSSSVKDLVSRLASDPTLIVTEKEGLAQRGGVGISFVKVDDKVRFELNQSLVEKKGMKVSSSLSTLALLVSNK